MTKNVYLGLLLACFVVIMIQYARGSYTTNQLEDTRAQLTELKDQAQALTEQYERAAAEAAGELASEETHDRLIMVAKVPKDCTKAIDWALQQAQGFKA